VELYIERYHLEESVAPPVIPSIGIGRSSIVKNGTIPSNRGDTQPIDELPPASVEFFAEDSSFADYFGVLPTVPTINRCISEASPQIVEHEEMAEMEPLEAPKPVEMTSRRSLSVLMNQRAKSPVFSDEGSNTSNAETKSHPSARSSELQAQTALDGIFRASPSSHPSSLSSSLDNISIDEDLHLTGEEDPTHMVLDDLPESSIHRPSSSQDSSISSDIDDNDKMGFIPEIEEPYMDYESHAALPSFWSSGPSLATSLRESNALEIIEDDRARFSFDDQLDDDNMEPTENHFTNEQSRASDADSIAPLGRFKKNIGSSAKSSRASATGKRATASAKTTSSKKRKRVPSELDSDAILDSDDDGEQSEGSAPTGRAKKAGSSTKRPKLKSAEPIIPIDELSCSSAPEVPSTSTLFVLQPEMSNPPPSSSTGKPSGPSSTSTASSSKRQNFRKINLKGGYKKTRMDRETMMLARSRKAAANAQARSAGTQEESPFDCWDESTMEIMLQPFTAPDEPTPSSNPSDPSEVLSNTSSSNTLVQGSEFSLANFISHSASMTTVYNAQPLLSPTISRLSPVVGAATRELRGITSSSDSANPNGLSIPDELLTRVLEENFKIKQFRAGQREAIQRVLSGQNTLLILPTGGGKSLCYQLPSLAFESGLTLVVSPLLSLISDQLSKLPAGLIGVSLGSNLSGSALEASLQKLKSGMARILFISPEKLASQSFLEMMQRLSLRIELLCVDEAHCLSTWSHNFRPSYLSIYRNAVEALGARRVLALTATATSATAASICESLHIPNESILRYAPIGEHVHLNIKMVLEKHDVLERILKSPELAAEGSVIVYVMFQKQADDLASYLLHRGFSTASYHAGKSPQERNRVQSLFIAHKIKIIIATVAFGMGIDQRDVRGVVHFSMPKSVENYVQEVGRAGRDGLPAHCHLLCHPSDLHTLRSLAHADTQDRVTVKALMLAIWPGERDSKDVRPNRLVALRIAESERTFDMKQSLISTILTWLSNNGHLALLPQQNATCELSFHDKTLDLLKTKSKLLQQCASIGKKHKSSLIVPLESLAGMRGKSIEETSKNLSELAETCGIHLSFRDPAMCIEIRKELFDQELDEEIDKVFEKIRLLESVALEKIDSLYRILTSDLDQPIHSKIQRYFIQASSASLQGPMKVDPEPPQVPQSQLQLLQADVRVFLAQCGEAISTARQVARIFHGISSPQYPKEEWQLNKFWAKSVGIPFEAILKTAQQEILAAILSGGDF
jgi:ATP-dependent DNA helicase Q4